MALVVECDTASGLATPGRPAGPPRAGRWPWALVLGALLSASGCLNWLPPNPTPPESMFPPVPILANDPVFVPNQNPDLVFETVVDVIDNYFKVDREIPIRLEGGVLVEGLIETYPRNSSTLLEPWGPDVANFYERVEGTLQSIRRYALVRVLPAENGFLVDVIVVKELEDVLRPETGSASRAANLRNDNSLRRYVDPVGGRQPTMGWIELGRDLALEQKILIDIASRFGAVVVPPPVGVVSAGTPPPGVVLPPDWVPPQTAAPEDLVPPDAGPPTGVELPPPANVQY